MKCRPQHEKSVLVPSIDTCCTDLFKLFRCCCASSTNTRMGGADGDKQLGLCSDSTRTSFSPSAALISLGAL